MTTLQVHLNEQFSLSIYSFVLPYIGSVILFWPKAVFGKGCSIICKRIFLPPVKLQNSNYHQI